MRAIAHKVLARRLPAGCRRTGDDDSGTARPARRGHHRASVRGGRAAFEHAVGSIEAIGWSALPAGAQDQADFRSRVEEHLRPSDFTRFLTLDHGDWLRLYGQGAKVVIYTPGNPLIAVTMLRHDIHAGLNVPVRVVIYRDEASETTRLACDVPSTLMGNIDDDACLAAAGGLDAKLAALAEQVTGSRA